MNQKLSIHPSGIMQFSGREGTEFVKKDMGGSKQDDAHQTDATG
jgi:hypothetical protein